MSLATRKESRRPRSSDCASSFHSFHMVGRKGEKDGNFALSSSWEVVEEGDRVCVFGMRSWLSGGRETMIPIGPFEGAKAKTEEGDNY